MKTRDSQREQLQPSTPENHHRENITLVAQLAEKIKNYILATGQMLVTFNDHWLDLINKSLFRGLLTGKSHFVFCNCSRVNF